MSELKQERAGGIEARIRAIAEEVLQGSESYVVDVIVRGNKGSRVVEVFVDSDAGLNVEELARVSREMGFLLDTEDVVDGRYSLNVSSPGADRPISLPRQFPKHVGRKFRVRYRTEEGQTAVEEGELESATADGIALRVSPSKQITLGFDDVIEARVLLPW